MNRIKQHLQKIKQLSRGKMNLKKILIWTGIGIGAIFVLFVLVIVILIAVVSIGLPDVRDLDKLSVAQSTTIYDREGNVLYVKYGGENRQYIPFDQISENIINATVAIEDDQFWEHPGFDAIGTVRAAINNIFHIGGTQGGSTITQQYIKNTFLSPEKSYIRKLKELVLSIQLEQTYDKKKIIELYLNKIPYGNNAYGIEKAAQIYFDKHAKDLDIAESAVLAALPQAPSYYNPYGSHLYSELTKQFDENELTYRKIISEGDLKDEEFLRGLIGKTIRIDDSHIVYIQGRTDLVLKTMEKNGYITEKQKEDALLELKNLKFSESTQEFKHGHFVMYILEQLEEKYGKELVEQGGLKVYTSLDPTLQDIGERVVKEGAEKNTKKYNAKNAALIALDTQTGEILAMVGSKGYDAKDIDGAVNITTSYRQPGSSFKPFVYAQAFLNRYSPASVVFDTQTRFGSNSFPKNYDGSFRGPMSIREALGQSRNIPAIKAYYLAGEQKPIMELGERMGLHFTERDKTVDHGWPLALGAAIVRPIDMASAFSVFGNGGMYHEPVAILKVEAANGEILEQWKPDNAENQKAVLDPQVAFLISSILSDKSVGLGENLNVPGAITAAKTGTSTTADNDKLPQDLWTVGYSTKLSTAVWSGNNRPENDKLAAGADGYTASAPIWKKFMTEALKNKPSENFPRPEGIKEITIAKASGKLPGPSTPPDQVKTELFASFAVPTEIDDSYLEATVDTRNNKLSNEYCPEDFVANKIFLNLHDIAPYPAWEEGVQGWSEKKMGETQDTMIIGPIPTTVSELCTVENFSKKPTITITEPDELANIQSGSSLNVEVKVDASFGMNKVEFYLDDQYKYFSDSYPFNGIVRLPKGELGTNHHVITVKAIDQFGYSGEDTIEIITDKNGSNTSTTNSDTDGLDTSLDSTTPKNKKEEITSIN